MTAVARDDAPTPASRASTERPAARRAGSGRRVDRLIPRDEIAPVARAADPGASPSAERPAQRLVVDQPRDRGRERVDIALTMDESGDLVLDELTEPADVGPDHRLLHRHRLERLERRDQLRDAETPSGIREHVDDGVQAVDLIGRN